MRSYVSVDYSVTKSELPFNNIHDHLNQAEVAMEHLTGIFTLLQFVREDCSFYNLQQMNLRHEKLTDALNSIGEMGAAIADRAFGNVAEAGHLLIEISPALRSEPVTPGQETSKKSKNK